MRKLVQCFALVLVYLMVIPPDTATGITNIRLGNKVNAVNIEEIGQTYQKAESVRYENASLVVDGISYKL